MAYFSLVIWGQKTAFEIKRSDDAAGFPHHGNILDMVALGL